MTDNNSKAPAADAAQGPATPPASVVEDEFTAGVNAVAAMLDKKADEYAAERGKVDPDTGTLEFGRSGVEEDYYNTLRELADEARDLVHGNSKEHR